MLASLTGPVLAVQETAAILDCHGVGYLAHCPTRTLAALEVGKTARLWVHLAVREDALTLFGFATAAEKEFFLTLTSVSGLGPKLGLSLLSTFTPEDIAAAITADQPAVLARASGVGKRLAEKIIVELKGKTSLGPLAAMLTGSATGARLHGPFTEVASALANLGYSPKVAEAATQAALEALPQGSFDQLFKTALQHAATS